jgi:hypothetical protein
LRRRIIDYFSGFKNSHRSFKDWGEELEKRLGWIIGLLEKGEEKALVEAKHRVNEMVVKRIAQMDMDLKPALSPMEIEIDNEQPL